MPGLVMSTRLSVRFALTKPACGRHGSENPSSRNKIPALNIKVSKINNRVALLISFPMAGIYIHIPFCRRACHYCDFYFSTNRHNQAQVIHAMVQEMHLQQTYLPEKIIETVYIGGGTPSLIDHTLLAEIFNALYKNFSVSPHAEVTLEANPDDLTLQALSFYASLGVNRLSIAYSRFMTPRLFS